MPEKHKSAENVDARIKVCGRCKLEKPRSEFYARRDRPVGVQSYCKKCTKNQPRWKDGRFKDEADKQHIYKINRLSYQRNKAKYAQRAAQKKAQDKIRTLEAYGSFACNRCGFDVHPAALEFHHRNPTEKLFNISTAIGSPNQFPWKDVITEIAKCELICSNCHRIEHAAEAYANLWMEK